MSKEEFKSFQLLDGRKCQIMMLAPADLWIATMNHSIDTAFRKENKLELYDMTPYLLSRIVRIDQKKATIKQLETLMMDDYLRIQEEIAPMLERLPKT